MKTITTALQPGLCNYNLTLLGDPDDLLFMDIETTGFAARSSVLYMIGCVCFENGTPTLIQYFAQKPVEEEKVLAAFLALCRQKKTLIHYNGNNFDIPYLKQKCASFGYQEPFSKMSGVDIYKRVMPYKNLLGVENLKQKTMEDYLGIKREDEKNGGELINVYRDYVTAALTHSDETAGELEQLLLLHNGDDCRGMVALLSLLSYADMLLQPFKVTRISTKKVTQPTGKVILSLVIRLRFTSPVPKPVSCIKRGCHLEVEGNEGILEIPLTDGELKYFYGNYREYYYLPEEDLALHKSVASYVAPEHRQQATAANCYTRKEGLFLPQWDLLFEPVYKTSHEDRVLYFEMTDEMKKKPEEFAKYASHILDFLMHEKRK